MAKLTILAGALALIALSHAALAFEEQKAATQPGGAASQMQAPGAAVVTGPAGAQLGGDRGFTAPTGTVITLPGLGKIGVLPKMDLGLELLYSATDGKTPPAAAREDEGLTIRGSIKHSW